MNEEQNKFTSVLFLIKEWLPSVIVFSLGIYFISTREYSLIDHFHLIVHEAGHMIFGFFGQVIMVLGGTLMQLIIPLLLMIYAYMSNSRTFFQFMLLLEGHSFINVSIYAGDAQRLQLRLFGPPGVKHDWNWLLTHFGIIEYTDYVSFFFLLLAGVCVAAATAAPLYFRRFN